MHLKRYLHRHTFILPPTCVIIAGLGNLVVFVLILRGSHWAEEYGLICGILLIAVVAANFPTVWKRSKRLIVVLVCLSMPMVVFCVIWFFRIFTYITSGDT